jgi:hypothetical protein
MKLTSSRLLSLLVLATTVFVTGCSTTQEIILAKAEPTKKISKVIQVLDADNSVQMNGNLEAALQKQGFAIKAPLQAGTRKSAEADALISYVDVWRWDITMYLRSLSVRLYDAQSGDLLVSGEWKDSPMHGFRDAKVVMDGLVTEVFTKLKTATKSTEK